MTSHSGPPTPATTVSPKVIAAGTLALVSSIVVALLNALQADSTLLGGLHPTVQFIAVTIIPPILVAFSGYQTRDPLRTG